MLWFFYALGAAMIWGINYAVSGRLLERGMSPQTLFLLDMIFGTIALALLISLTGKWQTTTMEIRAAQPQLLFLIIAVMASVSAGLLIFMSIEAKNATVASLIEVSYPLFTAFFAWVFFRQNTINPSTALGALLILTGVFIVARGNR